jgi:type I restriction enzyme S subunit
VALVDYEDVALAQSILKLDYAERLLLNAYALCFQLTTFAIGSTALGLKRERLHLLRNLIPRVPEQLAIVERIARATAKLDAVRGPTERTIALLKERGSALIAAVVTGQLDGAAA